MMEQLAACHALYADLAGFTRHGRTPCGGEPAGRQFSFCSHSEVVAQREGFEETRDYLQRSLMPQKSDRSTTSCTKSIQTKDIH